MLLVSMEGRWMEKEKMVDMEILEKTDELIDTILRSELVREYIEAKERMARSKTAQEKIRTFLQVKEQFEEVERFGKFHPDYKRIRLEALSQQRMLDMDEEISAFKEAERKLEDLFYEISLLLAEKVSNTIMVPGNSLFAPRSHCAAGGCSTSSCKTHVGL